MRIIQTVTERIEEELDDAEHYAKLAIENKERHPSLAHVFYELSLQEMNHMNMLHGEVTKLIEQHRREHGEPPAAMSAVYEYVHKRNIEEAKEVKMYQAQYRGE